MRKLKLWNLAETDSIDFNSKEYLVSEVSGLGAGFDLKEIQGHVYDVVPNFEDISLLVHFGVGSNAYNAFKSFADFIFANGNNKLVLEYDYNGQKRYCEVYPKVIPKTQKDRGVISETIVLKRMTPWFEKVVEQLAGSVGETKTVVNNSPWPIDLTIRVIAGREDADTIFKLTYPAGEQEIRITPTNSDQLIIDGETKRVYFPDTNSSAYRFIDKTKNTFLQAPPKTTSTFVNQTSIGGELVYKRWVLD